MSFFLDLKKIYISLYAQKLHKNYGNDNDEYYYELLLLLLLLLLIINLFIEGSLSVLRHCSA